MTICNWRHNTAMPIQERLTAEQISLLNK